MLTHETSTFRERFKNPDFAVFAVHVDHLGGSFSYCFCIECATHVTEDFSYISYIQSVKQVAPTRSIGKRIKGAMKANAYPKNTFQLIILSLCDSVRMHCEP